MASIDYILNNHIRLHPDMDEPFFGNDQVYVNYPVRFPTVTFRLDDNDFLCNIAEKIRADSGFPTLFDSVDDGWYEFYIGINSFTESKVDSCIEFSLCGSSFEDNEEIYRIDLSEHEQKVIYNALDKQCKQVFGKTCDELLDESQKMMEE